MDPNEFNFKEVLEHLKSPNFNQITSMKSFDFFPLFLKKLKSRLAAFIPNSFIQKVEITDNLSTAKGFCETSQIRDGVGQTLCKIGFTCVLVLNKLQVSSLVRVTLTYVRSITYTITVILTILW